MKNGHKVVLAQDIYNGRHLRICDDPKEALKDITDINSAKLLSVPESVCHSAEALSHFVDECISHKEYIGVLQTLKEKADAKTAVKV